MHMLFDISLDMTKCGHINLLPYFDEFGSWREFSAQPKYHESDS